MVMECIADSGGQVSTVDEEWFQTHISDAVTASGRGSQFPVRAANGLAIPGCGFLVRHRNSARAPEILGTNTSTSASGITMGEHESSDSQSAAQKSYGFARVASSSEQYIPAAAVSLIRVRDGVEGPAIFEALSDLPQRLFIADAVATNGDFSVPVCNLSDEPVWLNFNSRIGILRSGTLENRAVTVECDADEVVISVNDVATPDAELTSDEDFEVEIEKVFWHFGRTTAVQVDSSAL